MSVLEFISSVFSSLSWPLAVVIAVVVLRRPLRHLLTRLESLKGPGIEATFQRQLEEAKEEAVLAVEGPRPSGQQRNREHQAKGEYFDLFQLADLSPRAAIIEAWLRIESTLMQLALRNDVPLDSRAGFTSYLIEQLSERGLFSSNLIRPLKRLRNLRNVAVHEGDFELSRESVIDYIQTADFIVNSFADKLTGSDDER
jgi:hypothetical protein